MKRRRILSIVLTLCLVFGMTPITGSAAGSAASGFSDISGHWAENQIVKWFGLGVIAGDETGFRPDDPITRAEMATILDNLMDYQEKAENPFSDVPDTAWYADAVCKANTAGILLGDNAGHASPTINITREQAAAMLARAFAVGDGTAGNSSFTDAAGVSSWAAGAVFGMEAAGYINGYNGKFLPKAAISRAEVVTIINNVVKAYYTAAGTYTENVAGTAIIKVPDVVLSGVTITGNLIIAEGVAQGDATLDSVTVEGETVVRGGGENSIHITGDSHITSVRIEKVGDKLRIVVSEGNEIKEIEVAEGEDIVITGSVGTVEVNAPNAVVYATDAQITSANIAGENATIIVGEKSTIETVSVASTAGNTTIETKEGAQITSLTSNAEISVTGTGTVTKVNLNAGADGSTITTPKTETIVASGVTGATGGGGTAIPPGSTATNGTGGNTATVTPTPSTPPSGGGNNGGNGGGTVAVTGLTIAPTALSLTAGGATGTITPTIAPANASNQTITWTTSNAAVAIVANGVVTPVAAGNTTIRATSAGNTAFTTTCAVTVRAGTEATPIANNASNPSTVIELTGDTFTTDASIVTNWTITSGTTGLTVNTITLHGAGGVTDSLTIDCTGTSEPGTLTLQPKAAALSSGIAGSPVSVVIYAAEIATATTIANGAANPSVVVTLTHDTFTASADVQANWTGSAGTTTLGFTSITRDSDTQVTFNLNGTAAAGTLELQAKAAALTNGVASNTITVVIPAVASIASTNPTALTEAGANNGSLASGTVVVSIANGTLAADIAKANVTATNLPAGMDYTVTRTDGTTLTIGITGSATNHANANDVSSLTFTIAQAKVTGATGNLTTGNISIDFADPAASIASTNPTALIEAGANNGSLANGTVVISIANGTLADPLVKADVTATNLPAGMDYTVTRTSGTAITIGITGNATNHANANDVSALTFTIAQAKVTGATDNLTTGNISIDFADPAAPAASIASTNPTALTEAGANDGSLANGTVVISIANGTLADPLVKADVTATNLPAGMDYTVTRTSGTAITIGITGSATNHANANDVTALTFTIAQAKVTGATGNLTTGNISINFADPGGAGTAAATEGTSVIIYTMTTGQFHATQGAISANWTLGGTDGAELGSINGIVLSSSGDDKVATITISGTIGALGKNYTVAPEQAAMADGFTAPPAATVVITPAAVKTVTVGDLAGGAIKAATAAAGRTYAVTTANIANGQAATITWYTTAGKAATGNTPGGIVISPTGAVSSNALTLNVTVSHLTPTVEGSYYFTVTIDGVESAVKTLTIAAADAVTAELTGLSENLSASISPVLASGTYSYTLAAAYNEDQVTLTATLADATIKYSYGATVNKTVASGIGETIDLGFGANVITISVEKAGCLAASYTLTINRAELSNPDFGMSVAFGSINVSITGLKENGTANLVDFGDIYEVLSTSASAIRFYKNAGGVPEIELSFDELVSADDSEITFSTTSGAISIKGDIELGTGAFDTGGLFEDFEVFEHDRTEIRLVDASGDWNVSKTVAIPYLEAITTSSGINLDVAVTANAAYAGAADVAPYDLPAFLPNFNITGDPATYGAVTISGGADYVAAKNSAADIGENGIFKVKSWYGEITGHTTGLNNLDSLKSSLNAATDTFTFSATRDEGTSINAAVTLYIMEDNIGTIRYLQISLTGSGAGTGVTVAEVPKGNGDSTITSTVYTVSSHATELGSASNSVGSGTKPVIVGTLIGPFLANLQKDDYQGYIVTTAGNVPGNASVFGSATDKDPDTETLAEGDILTILSSDWSTIRSYSINVQSISTTYTSISATTPATPTVGNPFSFTINLRDTENKEISGLTLDDPTVATIGENGTGTLNITGASEDGTTGNYTITAIYTAVESFDITATILGQALPALTVTVVVPGP